MLRFSYCKNVFIFLKVKKCMNFLRGRIESLKKYIIKKIVIKMLMKYEVVSLADLTFMAAGYRKHFVNILRDFELKGIIKCQSLRNKLICFVTDRDSLTKLDEELKRPSIDEVIDDYVNLISALPNFRVKEIKDRGKQKVTQSSAARYSSSTC